MTKIDSQPLEGTHKSMTTGIEPPLRPLEGTELDLHNLLTINHQTIVPSPPPLASQTSSTTLSASTLPFIDIGAGSCGTIFAQDGKPIVLKLSKVDRFSLWNDYKMHTLIREKISQRDDITVHIPECYFYLPQNTALFDNYPQLAEAAAGKVNTIPTRVLATQRISPLPQITRTLLIDKFCRPDLQAGAHENWANRDCLVRVYLGSLRGEYGQGRFFSLRNLKMHLNQMLDFQLDVGGMAEQMGRSLAVMHWIARTDARDVEFVLGSASDSGGVSGWTFEQIEMLKEEANTGPVSGIIDDFFKAQAPAGSVENTTKLWLLDFNLVQKIVINDEGCIEQLVDAYTRNDPYYPRPCQELPVAQEIWDIFAEAYIEVATEALHEESPQVQEMPLLFLQKLAELEQQKQEHRRRTEETSGAERAAVQ